MTRRNPEVERLEREVRVLRETIARHHQEPSDYPITGCGDSSCVVRTPEGMRTNGGCRCDERRLRMAVQWWRRAAEFRALTIREVRDHAGPTYERISAALAVFGLVDESARGALEFEVGRLIDEGRCGARGAR